MLLKTDQTNCYNESGDAVHCGGSGQDGETNRIASKKRDSKSATVSQAIE
jgi:hypothetical protein